MRAVIVWLAMAGTSVMATELPVRRVVLYKPGIAYIERAGELRPGERVQLSFRAQEMDDVLKSITVRTAAERRVLGLRYDASDPLEVRLGKYRVQLGSAQPVSQLLDSLKGERIELEIGDSRLAGIILGARLRAARGQVPETEELILLRDDGQIERLDLERVSRFRFSEPALQAELQGYLGALAESRSTERRNVYVEAPGEGQQKVVVSYVVPAPVWKSSYRLFITGKEAWLEGWAIVENTSEDDWREVELSVVSGQPVSFVTHLYQPLYRQRPVMDVAQGKLQEPVVHEGAIAEREIGRELRAARPLAAALGAPSARAAAPALAPSTVEIAAQAAVSGELFEYRFTRPVTIPRGQSAMMPFVSAAVEGRKVLVFRQEANPEHPLHAVELRNSTGLTLDEGPVAVVEEGAYAGDAWLQTLGPGEKRLLSYAVDVGTRVTTRLGSETRALQELHMSQGVLTAISVLRRQTRYTVRNTESKPKLLIVESPVSEGYEVISPKPKETTARFHRFELELKPAATTELEVQEQRVLSERLMVMDQSPDVLMQFVTGGPLREQARQQLRQVVELRRKLSQLEAEINRRRKDLDDLVHEQGRLRENLKALTGIAGQQALIERYSKQLAEQEDQIGNARAELKKLEEQREQLQRQLSEAIAACEF